MAAPIILVPEKVPGVVADRQDFQVPDRVHQDGWVGLRAAASITNRLEQVDLDKLLEGFRHRPGRQDWIGEHAGKWLHAATLEWVNSGDPVLRTKLDYVAIELAKCQTPDGYLGTYVDTNRWTSWDVWTHKYNLDGLITYVTLHRQYESVAHLHTHGGFAMPNLWRRTGPARHHQVRRTRWHGVELRAGADGAAIPADRRAALSQVLPILGPLLGTG